MAAILSGGGALEWLARQLAVSSEHLPDLAAEAERSPVGARGLLFLPYLAGDRSPHMDRDARAAFVGLTAVHDRGDLARAVLEGVAFALRDGLNVLRELGVAPERIRFSGGGSRLRIWRRIVTDVLGLPTESGPTSQGSAFGAAILAAEGVGVSAQRMLEHAFEATEELVPDPVVQPLYDELYELYGSLYERFNDVNHRLAAFDRRQDASTPSPDRVISER
jgi:xylulokinase